MNFNKKVSECGRYDYGYEYMFVENGVRYYILFNRWSGKTFSIYLSSGKKRRELKVFEEKESISFNGIKVLLKILNIINVEFPKFYGECSLIAFWADSKRRRVYKRLENYGWKLCRIDGTLGYRKKFLAQDL